MQQALLLQQTPANARFAGNQVRTSQFQEQSALPSNLITPDLYVRLLGGFQLTWLGKRVATLDMPRLQSLLAYLILHTGAPQPRSQLAFSLWPDSSEEQALTNLRNLIHKLRKALPAVDTYLDIDRHTLLWRPDTSWTCDVTEFTHAIEAASAGNPDAQRQALEQALHLYQGDLLPACYEDWILPERDRLQQLHLQALERLISLCEQTHDYEAAIRLSQQLLRLDPLREITYRRLMRLHAARGDRASVLRTYQTCTMILKRELGITPAPKTRQVFTHLMQADAAPISDSAATRPGYSFVYA